ncbi:MAG TPA: hypothetical protein VEK75_15115 [Xanthobacteraceae bacterium]|nr:hypothetical protein [Xanthobacteraceae bacterium]
MTEATSHEVGVSTDETVDFSMKSALLARPAQFVASYSSAAAILPMNFPRVRE